MGSVQREGGGRGKNGKLSGQHITRTSRRVKKNYMESSVAPEGMNKGEACYVARKGNKKAMERRDK